MKALTQKLKQSLYTGLAYPGIESRELKLRKLILGGLTFNLTGILLLLYLAWSSDLERATMLLSILIVLMVFSIVGVWKRWTDIQTMYFIIELWSALFAFAFIVSMGGILNSGGAIFLGLTVVMTSMLLDDLWRIRLIFAIFVLAVIAAMVLQPILAVEPELTARQNLIAFVLMGVGLAAFMLQFNQTFWSQRLEMEKLKSIHLKDLDELKSHFYTNISHEFRTPLSVILGMARHIRDRPGESKKAAESIERNGNRLLRLVNQMLELTKLDSGKVTMHYIQTDIIQWIRYLAEPFQTLAKDKDVQLNLIEEIDQLYVDVDLEKIEQIMSNLLSNALRHTPKGGQIDLVLGTRVARVPEDSLDPGIDECLIVSVKDNGTGIIPEHIDRIFDRFYQVDYNLHAGGPGTGIGLAIVKEYVALLGGSITVDSTPGEGTAFTMCLPITRNASKQEVDAAIGERILPLVVDTDHAKKATYRKNKPLLLIIEDSQDVCDYLHMILRERFNLSFAGNGQVGLKKAASLIPDIVISDVMMPEMDGFEFLEKLRKDIKTSHIPVIMLTARADLASRLEGLTRGADAYLTKPFHKEELLLRLENLIELRKRMQQRLTRYLEVPVGREATDLPTEAIFLDKIRRQVTDHLSDEDFGISDLCRSLHLSRAQLYRKVGALTDQPVGRFIRTIRLQKARELLETSDMNVTQVALAVGFKNLSHFSQSFTDQYGMAPSKITKHSSV